MDTSEVLRASTVELLGFSDAAGGRHDLRLAPEVAAALAPDAAHLGLVVLHDSRDRPLVLDDADLPSESLAIVAWQLHDGPVVLLSLTAAELAGLGRTQLALADAQRLYEAGEELLAQE